MPGFTPAPDNHSFSLVGEVVHLLSLHINDSLYVTFIVDYIAPLRAAKIKGVGPGNPKFRHDDKTQMLLLSVEANTTKMCAPNAGRLKDHLVTGRKGRSLSAACGIT